MSEKKVDSGFESLVTLFGVGFLGSFISFRLFERGKLFVGLLFLVASLLSLFVAISSPRLKRFISDFKKSLK